MKKLTPADLATQPSAREAFAPRNYDSRLQYAAESLGEVCVGATTQTFTFDGKPADSDED